MGNPLGSGTKLCRGFGIPRYIPVTPEGVSHILFASGRFESRPQQCKKDITVQEFSLFGIEMTKQAQTSAPDIQKKYQELLAKFDSYQIKMVLAPERESMKCIAGAGCLSGDTLIKISRAKKSYSEKLSHIFLGFNTLGGRWKSQFETYVRSFCGDVIKLNRIKGVYFSGIKKVFLMTLENGFQLKLTAEHKVLTSRGYVPAECLTSSDSVMIDVLKRHMKTGGGWAPKKRYLEKRVGSFYLNAVKREKQNDYRAPEHRLIIEAQMNCLTFGEFISQTYAPNNLKLLSKESHIHHIDGNPKNNVLSNLKVMSAQDHTRFHSAGYLGFKHGIPQYSPFKSLEYIGEEKTYDIECESPHNNFAANRIIVHNSGKTFSLVGRAIKMVVEDKVCPPDIVLITFTNKAAREIKERYVKFFSEFHPEGTNFPVPHISTIHSFALTHIRRTFGFSRTILSEYQSQKLFRETCKKACLEHKQHYPEIATVNSWYEALQGMVAKLTILYAVFPLFERDGNLQSVLTYAEAKNLSCWKLIEKLPYPSLIQRITGKGERIDPFDIIDKTVPADLTHDCWVDILKNFLEEKYKSNTLDFSDMVFQLICLLCQNPDLLKNVHSRIKHIIMDEAQDCDNGQFVVCLLSDKDSFIPFTEGIKK